MSKQEGLLATPVKEQELSKEELGSKANELMNKLKTAISTMPEFQKNLPAAYFDDVNLVGFHKGNTKYYVQYGEGKAGDRYPYKKLEISTVTELNGNMDSFERVAIVIVKEINARHIRDGYIFHTGSSISEGRREDPQQNNKTAVKKIEEFILSLASSTQPSAK